MKALVYLQSSSQFTSSFVRDVVSTKAAECQKQKMRGGPTNLINLSKGYIWFSIYCQMYMATFARPFLIFSTDLGTTLQSTSQCTCIQNENMNDWTYFSLWRFWFTCKLLASTCTPSAVFLFSMRLQNVRANERKVVQEISINIVVYQGRTKNQGT